MRNKVDTRTRSQMIDGLNAVGINLLKTTNINQNLATFLQTYGNATTSPEQYVAAIANSCNDPAKGFDYIRFVAIKNALQEFTTINFGGSTKIEQLFEDYFNAYVTLEF